MAARRLYFVFPAILLVLSLNSFSPCSASNEHLNFLLNIGSKTSPTDQGVAAQALISRIIPQHAAAFTVEVDASIGPQNKDTFIIQSTPDDGVRIQGTSGVAVALGFNHYLKYYCHVQFSWAGDQLDLPTPLPTLASPVKVTTQDKFRYYQNVCTVSYSSAWWSWSRWQREIDWMALNGINLPLAFTGQEAIWNRVFLKMGLTQVEINSFFGGPAFLAWARMGNMRGWGGPLPLSWQNQQLQLQKQILARMRSLGIIPVLPAFSGHVPRAIKRLYPNASLTNSPDWGNFNSTYCCVSLLDFEDPLFAKIGTMFLQEQEAEYGTDHMYNTDTFNEMTPKSSDPAYLAKAGASVFKAMTSYDPQAIWVMQAWLFLNPFWKPPQVKALVTAMPQGRMLLLDLYSEARPQFQRFESFYGQPFIWNMLHNFGGTLGLVGELGAVNTRPSAARAFPNSTMVGVGLTPEGIHQNYIMYEFALEMGWRPAPVNLTEWVREFAWRRYGSSDARLAKAWEALRTSVYNASSPHIHLGSTVSRRPGLGANPDGEVWYDPSHVFSAWDYLMEAADDFADVQTYRYDVVDFTRQSLQLLAGGFFHGIKRAYDEQSKDLYDVAMGRQLMLLQAMENILSTDNHFMLGNWTNDARSWAVTDEEKKLYEFNARNQISLWGPKGNIMDYAGKQWGGVIQQYVLPRWQTFAKYLSAAIESGKPWDQGAYDREVFEVEKGFTYMTAPLPTNPTGDTIKVARQIYQTFRPYGNAGYFIELGRDHVSRGMAMAEEFANADIMAWKYGKN